MKFKPIGSAVSLAQDVCKISSDRKFEEVVRYLRRKLRCGDGDSVFLYVNSAFAPSLDEVVGNLHRVSFFFPFELRLVGELTGHSASRMRRVNSLSHTP